jgi:hypothetical protein
MQTKYTSIVENGRVVTGVEVSRNSHLGSRLGVLLLTAGFGKLYEPTPDTVVIKTPDGRLHTGPEQRRSANHAAR